MGSWAWRAGHGAQGTGWDKAAPLLQYHLLPRHYQFLLVAAFLILSLAEGSRLYLGYVGNLQEKVSAVSLPWPQVPCVRRGMALLGELWLCWMSPRPGPERPSPPVQPGAVLGGNRGCAGKTWKQGTKGTHSLSCCIPPCAVGATVQHWS